jgi:hypothetical protein
MLLVHVAHSFDSCLGLHVEVDSNDQVVGRDRVHDACLYAGRPDVVGTTLAYASAAP